jgi:splicing factor 3B subunit 3
VGLENGVLLRSLVDNITGQLTDSRQQFLGTRAVKLTAIKQKNQNAVVALSNESHLCYSHL